MLRSDKRSLPGADYKSLQNYVYREKVAGAIRGRTVSASELAKEGLLSLLQIANRYRFDRGAPFLRKGLRGDDASLKSEN